MIHFDLPSETISFEDPTTTARLLEHEQAARLAAEAEQVQLSKCYSVETLAARLDISIRSAYDLIRTGQIAYCLCGKKNFRISERAVRRHEDGLPPIS